MKFEQALRHVLAHEGGWSDHPRDPGGATMQGITLATYRDFKGDPYITKDQLRAIPASDVSNLYLVRYWTPVRAEELPSGLDYAVFDFGVNSGVGRASRMLQQCLGVTVDGVIGPKTLLAAANANRQDLIREYCSARLKFLQGLPTWPTFGRGWAKRVSDVLNVALKAAQP